MNKNDFNNIKIPENIDGFIEDSFNNAYKFKNKKRTKKISGIIAAGLTCFIMLGVTKPTIASVIPPLEKVFQHLQDRIINGGKGINYGTINETIKNNGVEVTLEDIIFDGKYLYASYIVKSDTPFRTEEIPINERQLLYEHNEKLSFTDEKPDSSGISGLEGMFIDDNTFKGVEKYNLSSLNAEIPDSFEFEILINLFRCFPIVGDDRAELMRVGDWGFKAKVNKEENLSKNFEINSTSNEGIHIKEIFVTPFEIGVTILHQEGTSPGSYDVSVSDKYGNNLNPKEGRWGETFSDTIFNKINLKGDELIISIYNNSSKDKLLFEKEVNIK
ncbi:DUF4179 domain-containing protein [Clostridium sp. AL.422]|uniref:DUF4179 domain-containing protein n=1 Tax=Clostridium TaxID=1485 RepID=UPI00293DC04A|nr:MULTISPECIES: DUF4179 domain-containing protein [unclassified Clostridium]MDV4150729.1 DUF4179 domain-containing protein [Clostridium sp. AL.422]